MKQQFYIKDYCHIKNNEISFNGAILFKSEESMSFSEFFNLAYRSLKVNYPKFFKMDLLSKLSFLAAHLLLKEYNATIKNDRNIALVFSNRSSSLDTDRKYQKSIEDRVDYFPSPSIFVYTLPNIGMGEISIRHGLFSENSFFIFDRFNAGYLYNYALSLLQTQKATDVVCGWVDVDETSYEAFLYWVGDTGNLAHTEEMISKLYTKN